LNTWSETLPKAEALLAEVLALDPAQEDKAGQNIAARYL